MTRLVDVLPAGAAARILAEFLASSITAAHAARRTCWGLTVRDFFVRLNVGTPEAISFDLDVVRVCALSKSLPIRLLDRDDVYLIEPEGRKGKDIYSSTPGSRLLAIDDLRARPLKSFLEAIQQSHLEFIRVASMSTSNPMTKKGHTPACIDELAKLTGRTLPQPSYWAPPSSVPPPTP